MSSLFKLRPKLLGMQLLDLSAPAGIGYDLQHKVGPMPMAKLDDFFEDKFIEKLLYFEDEYEAKLEFDYKLLLDIHIFRDILKEEHDDITLFYKTYLLDYQYAAKKAHYRILQERVLTFQIKYEALDFLDEVFVDLMEAAELIADFKKAEYEIIGLERLPIVDLNTKELIEENIDILSDAGQEIFMKACNNTIKTLDETQVIMKGVKKGMKLYGTQLRASAIRQCPITTRFLNNNWDNFNFHSNNKDKFKYT